MNIRRNALRLLRPTGLGAMAAVLGAVPNLALATGFVELVLRMGRRGLLSPRPAPEGAP